MMRFTIEKLCVLLTVFSAKWQRDTASKLACRLVVVDAAAAAVAQKTAQFVRLAQIEISIYICEFTKKCVNKCSIMLRQSAKNCFLLATARIRFFRFISASLARKKRIICEALFVVAYSLFDAPTNKFNAVEIERVRAQKRIAFFAAAVNRNRSPRCHF